MVVETSYALKTEAKSSPGYALATRDSVKNPIDVDIATGRDLYEVLGLSKSATPTEIKKAYRAQARRFHPDTNPDNPYANANFKRVSEAYEVLSDPERRTLYDELGAKNEREAAQRRASQAGQTQRANPGTNAPRADAPRTGAYGTSGSPRSSNRAKAGRRSARSSRSSWNPSVDFDTSSAYDADDFSDSSEWGTWDNIYGAHSSGSSNFGWGWTSGLGSRTNSSRTVRANYAPRVSSLEQGIGAWATGAEQGMAATAGMGASPTLVYGSLLSQLIDLAITYRVVGQAYGVDIRIAGTENLYGVVGVAVDSETQRGAYVVASLDDIVDAHLQAANTNEWFGRKVA